MKIFSVKRKKYIFLYTFYSNEKKCKYFMSRLYFGITTLRF